MIENSEGREPRRLCITLLKNFAEFQSNRAKTKITKEKRKIIPIVVSNCFANLASPYQVLLGTSVFLSLLTVSRTFEMDSNVTADECS